MSPDVLVALGGVVAGLLVGIPVGMRLGQTAKARQALRDEGICRAWDSVAKDLQACQTVHALLSEPNAKVATRWRDAFSLLLTGTTRAVRPEFAAEQLVALGFSELQAEQLVQWRLKRPGMLATVMLALVANVPDDELWGMVS